MKISKKFLVLLMVVIGIIGIGSYYSLKSIVNEQIHINQINDTTQLENQINDTTQLDNEISGYDNYINVVYGFQVINTTKVNDSYFFAVNDSLKELDGFLVNQNDMAQGIDFYNVTIMTTDYGICIKHDNICDEYYVMFTVPASYNHTKINLDAQNWLSKKQKEGNAQVQEDFNNIIQTVENDTSGIQDSEAKLEIININCQNYTRSEPLSFYNNQISNVNYSGYAENPDDCKIQVIKQIFKQ